jgi:hypothetical protein
MPRPRLTLSDVTGATVIRFETVDGMARNIDDAEAQRIGFGDVGFRAMPGNISGDDVEPFLYRVLRLDPHKYVFDLPQSVLSTGGRSAGLREGRVHLRELGKNSDPVGKVYFLTTDQKFRDDYDPSDTRDWQNRGAR